MGLGSSKPSSVFVISIRTDYIQNKSILKQVPFKPLVYPSEQGKRTGWTEKTLTPFPTLFLVHSPNLNIKVLY